MKRKLVSLFSTILPIKCCHQRITIDGIAYIIDTSTQLAEVRGSKSFTGRCLIPSSITYNGRDYEVRSIVKKAFWRCNGLTSLSIPHTVSSIGVAAFWGCRNLASIEIPTSIKTIGLYAFNYCESLEDVYYDSPNPRVVDDRIFDAGLYTRATLHVSTIGESKIKETAPWRYFKDIIATA